jgi:hypothetical protein
MAAESPIDFGDLLAHDVPIEWHEAVAVTQEVCANLFGARAVAPDPAHILLHASGTIELLTEAPSGEPAAQRLAYTLNALLQGTSPPAELRLFTSQVISGAATASIDEFTQRLAYFERPGRSRVLQQLYERAALDLAAARARSEASHVSGAKVAGVPPNTPTADARTRVRVWTRAAIAALVVLMFSALIVWGWPRVRTGYRHSRAAGVVNKTSAVVGSSIAGGVSSGRALLGKAGLIDVRDAVAPPGPETPRAVKVRSRRGHPQPAKTSETDSVPPQPAEPLEPPASSDNSVPAPPAAIAAEINAPDLTVYSEEDADVLPPALVWPQLSRSTRADETGSAPARGEVDLLVNERGEVERVKFLNKPERFRQGMLLSAMKAWRYHPAVKGGHPVRYVVRVTLPF